MPSRRRPVTCAAAADDRGDAGVEILPKIRVVFLVIGRRHQHADVAADHLGGGISEQPLGAAVEGLNCACAVDDDDAVDRRIDDRVEALRTLGRQRGFRSTVALSGAELMIGPRDSKSSRHEQAQRYEITRLPNSEAGRWEKKYMAASAAVAVATTPGPSPPYQAAIRIAGKNGRYGTFGPSQLRSS